MKYTTKEFKGQQIFQVWGDEQDTSDAKAFPKVSFGLKKAKAIVESIEAIKKFVTLEEAKKTE